MVPSEEAAITSRSLWRSGAETVSSLFAALANRPSAAQGIVAWRRDDWQGPELRCDRARRGRGGADVRRHRRAARPPSAADRPCRPGRQEDPDLGRRANEVVAVG